MRRHDVSNWQYLSPSCYKEVLHITLPFPLDPFGNRLRIRNVTIPCKPMIVVRVGLGFKKHTTSVLRDGQLKNKPCTNKVSVVWDQKPLDYVIICGQIESLVQQRIVKCCWCWNHKFTGQLPLHVFVSQSRMMLDVVAATTPKYNHQ